MTPASAVLIASAAFIFYVLFGYPLLLGFLARRRGKPVRKAASLRTVSVLIAVRDGERWIREKLESVLRLDYPQDLIEIIVISDGSDDGTDDIVRQFVPRVRLLRAPREGKSAALTLGMQHARHELLLLTDVRQVLAPGSLRHLAACFVDPSVGAVSGELLVMRGETLAEANVGLYWKYESWIRKRLAEVDSTLGSTGPFYAIRRELAVPIPAGVLLDDMFLPLAAFFRGYRLVVEEAARAYDFPTSLDTEFRRKVRTLAGNYQILRYYPALLGPRNRMWLHYVSYKLGRLLLPWVLLAAALASIQAPAALAAQACFYALCLADLAIPEGWMLKRISSPARTFVVLMAAAACAVSIFFVSPRTLWKPTIPRAAGQ